MAKFRIKNKGAITKKAQREINRAIRDSDTLEKAADILIKPMKKGKNPKTGRRYKALASSTIDQRKRMARYNDTSPDFSPRRSNLTFSGQLLDSITAKIFVTKSIVEIEPRGTRRKYRKKNGKPVKGPALKNKTLAEYHDKGKGRLPKRNIFSVSKKNVRKISKLIRSAVTRRFNK